MPLVLPDPDDATRVISSPQTQVAAPSVVPDETSEGATAVGRAITKLGDDITAFQAKRQTRLDESAYSQAVADFELANIQTVDSFTEDRDFANYDTNYTKQIIPKRDEFAKQITNPLFQQRFKNETDISISRARATLHGQGYKIEVQEGRAAFAKNSETYKNLYAIAKDEDARIAATEKYMADFESPNNQEYFNAEERQVLLEAWNEEANIARYNFLPLEEQVAAFKNNEPWLQDIDVGKRALLKKAADKTWEIETEKNAVSQYVNEIASKGGSITEMYDRLEKYRGRKNFSAEVETKVRAYIHQRFNEEQNKKKLIGFDAFDQAKAQIDDGARIDDIDSDLLHLMGTSARSQLEAYAIDKKEAAPEDQLKTWARYQAGLIPKELLTPELIDLHFPKDKRKETKDELYESMKSGKPFEIKPDPTVKLVNRLAIEHGYDLSNDKDEKRVNSVMLVVQDQADAYFEEHKRWPDRTTVTGWTDIEFNNLHYNTRVPFDAKDISFNEYRSMPAEDQAKFRKGLVVPPDVRAGLQEAWLEDHPGEELDEISLKERYLNLLSNPR